MYTEAHRQTNNETRNIWFKYTGDVQVIGHRWGTTRDGTQSQGRRWHSEPRPFIKATLPLLMFLVPLDFCLALVTLGDPCPRTRRATSLKWYCQWETCPPETDGEKKGNIKRRPKGRTFSLNAPILWVNICTRKWRNEQPTKAYISKIELWQIKVEGGSNETTTEKKNRLNMSHGTTITFNFLCLLGYVWLSCHNRSSRWIHQGKWFRPSCDSWQQVLGERS